MRILLMILLTASVCFGQFEFTSFTWAQIDSILKYAKADSLADNTTLVASGGQLGIKAGSITNSHVSSGAAIAGTKIAPDFGAQNIVTTGDAIIGSVKGALDVSGGEVDNVVIGSSTPAAGTFTTLEATGLGVGTNSIESTAHIVGTAQEGADYDEFAEFIVEAGETRFQLIAENNGNDAGCLIFSNVPTDGTSDNKHWIMGQRGPTSNNRFDLGYTTSTESGNLVPVAYADISITTDGDVGIGTVSPSYKLDVNGDIQATSMVLSDLIGNIKVGAGNAGYFGKYYSDGNSGGAYNHYTYLSNNGFYVPDSAYNVFYATNQYIDVMALTINRDGFHFLFGDAAANGDTVAADEVFTINPDGELGGNVAVENALFAVDSLVVGDTSGVFTSILPSGEVNYTSDRQKKENITSIDLDGLWDNIEQMQPKEYSYKKSSFADLDTTNYGGWSFYKKAKRDSIRSIHQKKVQQLASRRHRGFMAQDVGAILGRPTQERVSIQDILVIQQSMILEMKSRIEDLEERVSRLEGERP